MVARDVSEADWKTFRELREFALERFCSRVLDELETLRLDASRSQHERYLAVYRLVQDRDQELAHAFNGPRRSQMIMQLAAIYGHGLLEPGEFSRFTPQTRASIELLTNTFPR